MLTLDRLPPTSLLFVPGIKVDVYLDRALRAGADGLIFDLEDSVAPEAKDAARLMVTRALTARRPDTPVVLRVNSVRTDHYENDIDCALEVLPDVLMLSKVEHRDEIREAETVAERIERALRRPVQLIAPIESLAGHFDRKSILATSERLLFHVIGYEDLSAELGIERPALDEWNPLSALLMENLLTARFYRLPMMDAVCRYFKAEQLFEVEKEASFARRIGLSGKIAIHPDQVPIINRVFDRRPLHERLERTVELFREKSDGTSVIVNENGGMEDYPSLAAAERVLANLK